MDNAPFISICILSYNRPETLLRLLRTIDATCTSDIEVVVCEDCSPRQKEIRAVVSDFASQRPYPVRHFENERNLGYDGTFNRLVQHAAGRWLVFMGDDDEFVPHAFDKMYAFLKEHPDLGYVMKSHYLIHADREREKFRYFRSTEFFPPGVDTYVKLFRRSVFIAGFTVRREYAVPFITDRFDGTMLMQLYLLAEVVLTHPSAYFDEPFTQQYASHEHNAGDVMFDREKKKFIPRRPTLDISLKFLKSFADITAYIDQTHHLDSTRRIKHDMSKYFYPSLAIHRDAGLAFFLKYVRELNRLEFNASVYYYIYVFMLVVLGRRICDWGIYSLKRMLGYTPQL
jgi:abequosyltransferase